MAKNFWSLNKFAVAAFKDRKYSIILFLSLIYLLSVGFIVLSYLTPSQLAYKVGETARSTLVSRYTFSYFNKFEIANLEKMIDTSISVYYDYINDHDALYHSRTQKFYDILNIDNDKIFKDKIHQNNFQFSQLVQNYITQNRFLISRYSNRLDYLYNLITTEI